jgi:2-polyprenyl-3-methyl-5-hydroxy-6-metoxy-1,4-benzoquinol methylase
MEQVTCDLCGSSNCIEYFRAEDSFFNVPGLFSVVRCSACGLLYTNPRPNADEILSLYDRFYDHSIHGPVHGQPSALIRKYPLLRTAWHALCGQYMSEVIRKSAGNVLDIGCGHGDLMEDMRDKGCHVEGVEPNLSSATAAAYKGFLVHRGSFEEISLPENHFDVLIFWHVLEHLFSPKTSLIKARTLLKAGGRVFICCPNADSYLSGLFKTFWSGWHLPFHFHHFTIKTIEKLAHETGFKIEKMRAVTPEYSTLYSLQSYMNHHNHSVLKRLCDSGIFRSFFFRGSISLVFRLLDFLRPGKGEFLRVELCRCDK